MSDAGGTDAPSTGAGAGGGICCAWEGVLGLIIGTAGGARMSELSLFDTGLEASCGVWVAESEDLLASAGVAALEIGGDGPRELHRGTLLWAGGGCSLPSEVIDCLWPVIGAVEPVCFLFRVGGPTLIDGGSGMAAWDHVVFPFTELDAFGPDFAFDVRSAFSFAARSEAEVFWRGALIRMCPLLSS